ncbi:MAG: aminoacetone oxidase family FAD-binding enzyme [Sphaerochaeta sp.]|jgi:predicted Rossmann fold flavoprotein|nr:aminoacetone oxidase family FAD-binding enzyme [Sphaerochaeta sp.]
MEHYDIIIIGGGAAGLFARANLTAPTALLLEGKAEVAAKLLITGGGMCNITNTLPVEEFLTHFATKGQRNFLLPALQTLPPHALRLWFEDHGVPTIERSDGKVFPASLDAREVRDCLLSASRIPIRCREQVKAIEREREGFALTTDRGEYHTRSLIVATGGMSYPATGSDGSLYPLLRKLGHTIVEPKPALVGLIIRWWRYSALSGSSMESVTVTATHEGENKPYYSGHGDLLFTHRGLSGPPILTLSGGAGSGDTITVSFVEEPMERLNTAARSHPQQQVATLAKEVGLTKALALALLESAGIDPSLRWAQIETKRRRQLCALLSAHPFTVERTMGFGSAMVTRGGVALGEVNRKTMESRIHSGLFFCGEVLDYDGESGGFNLQGAFSTALLAAHQAGRIS